MKFYCFVILLIFDFAYSEKEKCLTQMNIFESDKMNMVRVIFKQDKIGFIQCGKICNQFPECGAVNFNKGLLSCELVGTGATTSELVNATGWKFMYKTDFQQMYVSDYCGNSTRCIKLSSGQTHSSSVELLYTDCFYTPTPGVYKIKISQTSVVRALCQDGGWMVIQHKIYGSSQNFSKPWNDCKYGFDIPDGEHWLGNEHVYQYTLKGQTELKVVLDNDPTLYAQYGSFQLSNETDKYRLSVNGYTGNAGDSLHYPGGSWSSDGMMFSTFDSDNDLCSCNCAAYPDFGPWWLNYCSASSLNGRNITWMLQNNTQSEITIRRKP